MKSKIFKLYSEENQTISTQIEKMYSLEEMQEMDGGRGRGNFRRN